MPRTFYQQCLLRKQGKKTTRLLPTKYAIVGRVVKLKRADGAWDEGWRVESVIGDLVPPSQVAQRRAGERDRLPRAVPLAPLPAPLARPGQSASDCPPPPRAIA